jgi:hypothetical protein
MPDMLEQAVGWLGDMRTQHLSRTVEYVRGAESVELSATLGSTRYELTDDAGATLEAKATDFIVAADELVLGGAAAKPQIGDRIRLPAGASVLVFEVLDLAGSGHWRPADPFGKALRIHAKQIDEATP